MNFSACRGEREGWETLARVTHFENAHLRVATETLRATESSRTREWTVVHRKTAVVIAPLTLDGKLVLIRQERIPIRAAIWEVPAGQIDEEAAAATVALRELREETGYTLAPGGELIPLGHFFSSPGFTDERGFFFLARGVEPCVEGHRHEDSESILACRAFTPGEIASMIVRNEIEDANTLSICAQLVVRGFLVLGS